jgi:3-hydroxyacyl-[acyl-carrier-protein] dehydratase
MASGNDLIPQIPHRPPWSLVDRVVEVDREAARVVAVKRVSAGDPLVDGALPGLYVVEALAQAAACLRGAEHGAHGGMLVAAQGCELAAQVSPGDTLTLTATRRATLGALHRFRCEARVDERVVMTGELTFAIDDGTAA